MTSEKQDWRSIVNSITNPPRGTRGSQIDGLSKGLENAEAVALSAQNDEHLLRILQLAERLAAMNNDLRDGAKAIAATALAIGSEAGEIVLRRFLFQFEEKWDGLVAAAKWDEASKIDAEKPGDIPTPTTG